MSKKRSGLRMSALENVEILTRPVIVVIAYNREVSLRRLLRSVERASYPAEDIRLIISIDKSDNSKVEETAREFVWTHGDKTVRIHEQNLGLKKHVFECSEYACEYGSAILLEDDLYVSPHFYEYAVAALEKTRSDARIAGVSLYNHLLNVHAREPFEAIADGYDNYYFQFASSWGQAFTADQWRGFREWYEKNSSTADVSAPVKVPDGSGFTRIKTVPANVCGWGDKSWLKFFIRYMVEKNKYFLYPRVSLTTNFSDAGTHDMGQQCDLQVPLLMGGKNYSFSSLDESGAVYDAYFENERILQEAELDLYGKKSALTDMTGDGPSKNRTLISSQSLPYKVVKSYGRVLRPLEANIIEEIPGNDFFQYDLSEKGDAPKVDKSDRLLYNYRAFKAKYGLEILKKRIREKIK